MDMKVRVMCRPEVAPGFELAGVNVDRVEEPAAAAAVSHLADDPKVGILLLEERLHRVLPEPLVRRIDRRAWPLLIPFPSPNAEGPSVAEDYVLEILRQAVGYRVRAR
jgi:vacuolar-type H+-ATPase subunit F/Vma7